MDRPVNLEGMREAAASATLREEFTQLTTRSRQRAAQLDLTTYLKFLTFMSGLSAQPPRRRQLVSYSRSLL